MRTPAGHLKVPLIDLDLLHGALRGRVLERIAEVYDSGRFVLGPHVRAFEAEAALHLNVPHALGVSNGTDALVCALGALKLGRGHTLVTTPLSFVATATACLRTGAELRFVDVDATDFNLSAAELARVAHGSIDAVVVVHLFGQPADVPALRRLVPARPIVEDAAQAFGARLAGVRVGGLGELGAFSFFPGKPLGGLGDGGLVTTRDPLLAARVVALRSHGRSPEGPVYDLGGNYRLDELQAAVLRIKLEADEQRRLRRCANAHYYASALAGVGELQTPGQRADTDPAWSVYSVRVLHGRDALRAHLERCGIETALYYPRPLHLEPALSGLGYARGDFPVAEACAEQLLALPIHAELSEAQLAHVVASVAQFFGHRAQD
jgi:dTDP-4-amino-4,6-dideoxygalactose transaminase